MAVYKTYLICLNKETRTTHFEEVRQTPTVEVSKMSRKNSEETAAQGGRTVRTMVRSSQIVADERNRRIAEDEEFEELVESVRTLGILAPLHVQRQPDGSCRLIDGERRFRAAQKAG